MHASIKLVSKEHQLEKDGERYCDRCGQKIPTTSKLFSRNESGDLCLRCRIEQAEKAKGRE
jgi:CRISPR/Cas system-associated protein Cas10 (large subunit of type III CRISPR-Cas system)